MKQLLCLSTFLVILLAGCKKTDNEGKMPKPSQSGANIIAFKANGQVRVFKGKGAFLNDVGVGYQRLTGGKDARILINASSSYDYLEFDIHADSFNIELNKTYIIKSETSRDYARYKLNSVDYVSMLNSGTVNFTHCDAAFASGTFSFILTSNKGEKVEITEGFFDITNDR